MTDDQVEQATVFKGYEAPDGIRDDGTESHKNHYSRLALANSGNWNGFWRDEHKATEQDNHAIVDAIAGQLELTSYQRERAHAVLDSLPRELLGAYQSALLALAVCGVVAAEDGRDYHPNKAHPNSNSDTVFVTLFEETGAQYSKFYSCWNRVSSEI
jgi:hypothetical protein